MEIKTQTGKILKIGFYFFLSFFSFFLFFGAVDLFLRWLHHRTEQCPCNLMAMQDHTPSLRSVLGFPLGLMSQEVNSFSHFLTKYSRPVNTFPPYLLFLFLFPLLCLQMNNSLRKRKI